MAVRTIRVLESTDRTSISVHRDSMKVFNEMRDRAKEQEWALFDRLLDSYKAKMPVERSSNLTRMQSFERTTVNVSVASRDGFKALKPKGMQDWMFFDILVALYAEEMSGE